MRLYKYRKLEDGDLVAMGRFQDMLLKQEFWCARPDTLNDDQEFSWRCNYQPTAHTIGLLARLMSQERESAFAEMLEKIEALVSTESLESLAAPAVADLIQQCRSGIGLLCLGTSPSNPTLWHRYGGNGEGVCIELVAPEHLIEECFFSVQYVHEKVVHIDDLLRGYLDSPREMYSLALLTKSIKWKLEEEVRFISAAQNVPISMEGALSSVYLGAKLSEAVRNRVKDIANSLPYKVELHEQSIT